MAFGKSFNINFPEEFREHVKNAVENNHVRWIESSHSSFAGSSVARFKWAGCTWGLDEWYETVESITLLRGKISEQSIVFEKLKNGNT